MSFGYGMELSRGHYANDIQGKAFAGHYLLILHDEIETSNII